MTIVRQILRCVLFSTVVSGLGVPAHAFTGDAALPLAQQEPLPPEQRRQMRQQMREYWQQLPPEERRERRESFRQMPPEDRSRMRDELRERRNAWDGGGHEHHGGGFRGRR